MQKRLVARTFSQRSRLFSFISVAFSRWKIHSQPGRRSGSIFFFYFSFLSFHQPDCISSLATCPCRFILLPKRNAKLVDVWPRSRLVIVKVALEIWQGWVCMSRVYPCQREKYKSVFQIISREQKFCGRPRQKYIFRENNNKLIRIIIIEKGKKRKDKINIITFNK